MTTKVLPAPADSSHTANLLQQYGRGPVLLEGADHTFYERRLVTVPLVGKPAGEQIQGDGSGTDRSWVFRVDRNDEDVR